MSSGKVIGVASSSAHEFSKRPQPSITLIAGQGVAGDAHCGPTVKHRSRVKVDPDQPNLRQVHLIHAELFEELAAKGFAIEPAQLGENITTTGINLLELPRGTVLAIGANCEVEITGLRNPCKQIEAFRPGLLQAVVERTPEGEVIRKSGVMGVVLAGGEIRAGDSVRMTVPPEPHQRLERV